MKHFLVILILILPLFVAAQQSVKARVSGLESNAEYMALLTKENKLKIKEDSLTKVVATVRAQFKEKPEERAKYGNQILELEGDLFDVRNQIGMVASQISAIEQEYVINNLDKQTDPFRAPQPERQTTNHVKPLMQSANFVDNLFLRENLSTADYDALRTAQSREMAVTNYMKIYRNNYNTISKLDNTYRTVETAPQADSIFSKYRLLTAINSKINDSISTIWGYIYDNKSYTYNYLMDKMNHADELMKFEQRFQNIRGKEAEMRGVYASDAIAVYPLRKQFLLDYEIRLSTILGLDKAADSLRKVRAAIDTTDFAYKKVEIKERYFIDYESAEILSPSPYNARNPIPKCEVYRRGTVYRILVGTYPKLQAVSIFRGVSPLGYLKGEDGKYSYYAGAYATQAEAIAGVELLRKAGFRAPEVVKWEHGKLIDSSAQEATSASDNIYTVEISTTGDDLSESAKKIIATEAPGKEISRIDAQRFVVGSFATHTEAERLASLLRTKVSGLSAKVANIAL